MRKGATCVPVKCHCGGQTVMDDNQSDARDEGDEYIPGVPHTPNVQEPEAPPETFVGQVKDALEHLYNLGYLQHHPLAQRDGARPAEVAQPMAGQHLRQELAAAIEGLNPGAGIPFLAPHARLYNLVRLRYVERMTVREAGRELGLSLRQAHRDLRRGEEGVATYLWTRRFQPPQHESDAMQLSSFQAEMSRLVVHAQPTDVCVLLQRAQDAVARLAAQREIRFCAHVPPEPVMVTTDPVVAEQVLVNLLSQVVQQSCPGALELELTAGDEQASLSLGCLPEPATIDVPVASLLVAQLVDHLGWTVRQAEGAAGRRVVTLRMAVRGPTVLVVDDNEGLVELLERYLTDQACRVIAATNGQEGLRLAEEASPDAIVLDVMMPGMHGWEFLQRLRNQPQTRDIPVLVCSIINNPELAYSLGASLFLAKPVSRDGVLNALRQLGVV